MTTVQLYYFHYLYLYLKYFLVMVIFSSKNLKLEAEKQTPLYISHTIGLPELRVISKVSIENLRYAH